MLDASYGVFSTILLNVWIAEKSVPYSMTVILNIVIIY